MWVLCKKAENDAFSIYVYFDPKTTLDSGVLSKFLCELIYELRYSLRLIFHIWCHIVTRPLVEKTILSSLVCFCTLVKNQFTNFTPYIKINSKWTKDLNINILAKTIEFWKMSINLHDLGFVDMTAKTWAIEQKIYKLDCNKI